MSSVISLSHHKTAYSCSARDKSTHSGIWLAGKCCGDCLSESGIVYVRIPRLTDALLLSSSLVHNVSGLDAGLELFVHSGVHLAYGWLPS